MKERVCVFLLYQGSHEQKQVDSMKRKLEMTLTYGCWLEVTFLRGEQMFRGALWTSTQLMTLSPIIKFNSSLLHSSSLSVMCPEQYLLWCWCFHLHIALEHAILKVKTWEASRHCWLGYRLWTSHSLLRKHNY